MIIATLEYMMYEGLRNGMSLKQIKARIPALVATKLNITVPQFHEKLEAEAGPRDRALNALAERIVAKFSPSEQRAIALRK